jgi:hypothetical protein
MRPRYYTLIGQTPVPVNALEWAIWFETSESARLVAQTEIGASRVSTVFLGLDHRVWGEGPPLLFETMVFTDGDGGGARRRCSTWLEAEAQHAAVVEEWRVRCRG